MTIDMHAHWRPPELIDALRSRATTPRIEKNDDGVEVLNDGRWNLPVEEAFDDVDKRLAEMDELGISTAVLSIVGGFTWIERLPVEQALPLVQIFNDSVSAICQKLSLSPSRKIRSCGTSTTSCHRSNASSSESWIETKRRSGSRPSSPVRNSHA